MPCLAHLRPRSWSAGASQGGICDEPIAAAGACVNVHPSIRAKARPAWTGLALFPFVQLTTKEDCQTLGVTVLVPSRRRSSVEATCSHPGDHTSACVP